MYENVRYSMGETVREFLSIFKNDSFLVCAGVVLVFALIFGTITLCVLGTKDQGLDKEKVCVASGQQYKYNKDANDYECVTPDTSDE